MKKLFPAIAHDGNVFEIKAKKGMQGILIDNLGKFIAHDYFVPILSMFNGKMYKGHSQVTIYIEERFDLHEIDPKKFNDSHMNWCMAYAEIRRDDEYASHINYDSKPMRVEI